MFSLMIYNMFHKEKLLSLFLIKSRLKLTYFTLLGILSHFLSKVVGMNIKTVFTTSLT